MDKRIRASKIYADWAARNRGPACLMCDSSENLHVHHVTELHQIIRGLWNLYGDWEAVFNHCQARHQSDLVDNATLCRECHSNLHPGKCVAKREIGQRIALWAVLPRNLDVQFGQGTKCPQKGSLGLISFQTMIGIGWHIMNQGAESMMVEFNRIKFAKLLGKKPGTSFNKSLESAINVLIENEVILEFIRCGPEYEVHLHPKYVDSIENSPWFFPMEYAQTSKMLVLTLRWLLSFKRFRKFKISRQKLKNHLNLKTPSVVWMDRAIINSVKDIKWVDLKIHKGIYHFDIKKRGAVPIHSLREILREVILQI